MSIPYWQRGRLDADRPRVHRLVPSLSSWWRLSLGAVDRHSDWCIGNAHRSRHWTAYKYPVRPVRCEESKDRNKRALELLADSAEIADKLVYKLTSKRVYIWMEQVIAAYVTNVTRWNRELFSWLHPFWFESKSLHRKLIPRGFSRDSTYRPRRIPSSPDQLCAIYKCVWSFHEHTVLAARALWRSQGLVFTAWFSKDRNKPALELLADSKIANKLVNKLASKRVYIGMEQVIALAEACGKNVRDTFSGRNSHFGWVQRTYLEVAWLKGKQASRQTYKHTSMYACRSVSLGWFHAAPSPPLSLGGSYFFRLEGTRGEGRSPLDWGLQGPLILIWAAALKKLVCKHADMHACVHASL